MSLRRILILLQKELVYGSRNFIFLMALGLPIVFTLLVNLIFGTFFSGKSRLGVVDQGRSELVPLAQADQSLILRTYASVGEMEDAAALGAIDMGIYLPEGIDSQLRANETARITVYVWGESSMRSRIILGSALVSMMRKIAGQEPPVEIVETVLGAGVEIPWEKRLLPLMVLMSILIAGTMVPATSLVNEKTKRTLSAIGVSPATLWEIFTAKGLFGVLVSLFTGIMILFLNQAFGTQPTLLVGVLLLGSIFSSGIGVILGALVKDITTLMTVVKSMGIFLYTPGIIYIFPEIPQWIGRLFPTYYIIQPVLDITQENASFADVAPEIGVLIGLILLSIVIISILAGRTRETQAAA
jgi:ABC-2 type transport system permease protein